MALDFFEIILICNSIAAILYIVTAVINFKNYVDLSLTDNLLIGIYFLFWAIQVEMAAISLVYGTQFWIFADLTLHIHLFALFLVAVRLNWNEPPIWIYLLSFIYIYGLLAPFFSTFEGRWAVEQSQLFPGLNELTYAFVILSILFSDSELNLTRIKNTKNLWLIGTGLHLLGGILAMPFLYFGMPFIEAYVFLAVLLPQYLGVIFLTVLHIFYPEAILITEEQLHRARNILSKVDRSKPEDYPKIGADAIRGYLQYVKNNVDLEDLGILLPDYQEKIDA